MVVQVKICGLTSAAAVRAAATAQFAGFVFYPPSPRHRAPEEAYRLAALLPASVKRVAVMVDPDDSMLRETLAAFQPDFLQLHGRETPARVAAIKRGFGLAVIKAVPVAEAADLDAARAFEDVADWLLFDAKPRPGALLPGGNALSFDWGLLANRRWARPWLLSGGLNPGNVRDAIARTGAAAVDVSSGVENRPGDKNPALITDFITAVRGASPAFSGTTDRATR